MGMIMDMKTDGAIVKNYKMNIDIKKGEKI